MKKKVFTGFLSDHPSSGLTRQVNYFTSGQLQSWILNKTNPAKAGHPKKLKKIICFIILYEKIKKQSMCI
jgi:hypothetical protein